MELAEVYRIKYNKGPSDMLRGTVVCKDEENGHQYLFNDKDLDDEENFKSKRLVRSLDHIIPNGPTKASICAKNGFSISSDLFGVIIEDVTIEYPCRRPETLSTLTEELMSEDGTRYLTVLYAIFKNAVEAHVNVTLSNNSEPFYLYGVVAARTSAIDRRAYSSLIFLREHGEKIKVGNGDDIVIPLSRHIVAVPLGSQLILEFSLNVCDNNKTVNDANDKMVERIATFDAKRDGTSTTSINSRKGVVKVEVKWTSTRKPREPEAQLHKPTE